MAPIKVAEISRRDLRDHGFAASISDVKHLSSYSWIEAPTPTIAVPGSPPLWSPSNTPQRLRKDSGLVYIAQNAARHPKSPMEPLFRALYIANPSFDISSIDVVTDRNNIRKLLSFINPHSSQRTLESFAIRVEVVKNTALFSRVETAVQEIIGPHEFKGYGREFEKRYTTNRIKDSTGYHRILSYSFGDMSFVIRHETDGYVYSAPAKSAPDARQTEDDKLSNMLGSLSLSTPTCTTTGLTVKCEGQAVAIESTLEIKTRVFHKTIGFEEVAPQLWVSQTPNLVRAYHKGGLFGIPHVEHVGVEIKKWEKDNETDLRKLATLIHQIIKDVQSCGGYAVARYDDRADTLKIWKEKGAKMLADDLYAKWHDEASLKAPSERPDRTDGAPEKNNPTAASQTIGVRDNTDIYPTQGVLGEKGKGKGREKGGRG